jgi:hypothetical protein
MIAAVSDMETAYNDAVSRTGGIATVNEIGGTTLAPGVYTLDAITINGDVTFDATPTPSSSCRHRQLLTKPLASQ